MFIDELNFAAEKKEMFTGDKKECISDKPLDDSFKEIHINNKIYYFSDDYKPKSKQNKLFKAQN